MGWGLQLSRGAGNKSFFESFILIENLLKCRLNFDISGISHFFDIFRPGDLTEVDDAWRHDLMIPCTDHQLELTTQKLYDLCFLPAEHEHRGNMKKCRAIVGFFNSSTQQLEHLFNAQRIDPTLCPTEGNKALVFFEDIVTRWWSTFNMLERLVKLKSVSIASTVRIAKCFNC